MGIIRVWLWEELASTEADCVNYANLIDGTCKNLLEHLTADDVLVSSLRWALKQLQSWRLSCQCKGCKTVNDQVDPEELNWLQG